MTFWQEKRPFSSQPPKKHYFLGFFWDFLFLIFHIFLFTFSNIKKTKTKSAHFFSRTLLLTTWQIAKKYFRTPYTLLVILNIPKKHYKIGEKQATKILDQVLTQPWTKFWLKKTQILDQVLTLQHIYIYTLRGDEIEIEIERTEGQGQRQREQTERAEEKRREKEREEREEREGERRERNREKERERKRERERERETETEKERHRESENNIDNERSRLVCQKVRPKCQTKMSNKSWLTHMQTNSDKFRIRQKSGNFRKIGKFGTFRHFRKIWQIQTNSDKFSQIQTKSDKLRPKFRQSQTKIQTKSENFRQFQENQTKIRKTSDKFRPIFCLNLSEFVWFYSKFVWICLILSEFCSEFGLNLPEIVWICLNFS